VFWFKNLVVQAKNHSHKPNGGLTHPEPPQLETANRARPTTYVQLLQLRWKFHCYIDFHGNIDVVLYQNNFRVAEALTLTFVIQGEEYGRAGGRRDCKDAQVQSSSPQQDGKDCVLFFSSKSLVPFWRYISIKNVLERLCRSQLSKVA
jgi:hypothetical protein